MLRRTQAPTAPLLLQIDHLHPCRLGCFAASSPSSHGTDDGDWLHILAIGCTIWLIFAAGGQGRAAMLPVTVTHDIYGRAHTRVAFAQNATRGTVSAVTRCFAPVQAVDLVSVNTS
jgi:hypothetical protein